MPTYVKPKNPKKQREWVRRSNAAADADADAGSTVQPWAPCCGKVAQHVHAMRGYMCLDTYCSRVHMMQQCSRTGGCM